MHRSTLPLIAAALGGASLVSSCFNSGQGQSPLQSDPFATSADLRIEEVSNGFGRLLPHVVHQVDPVTGVVSPDQLVEIRSIDDMLANPPSALNPVLAPATWPVEAKNPQGVTGNHFVAVRFSRTIKKDTIFDPGAGGLLNNGLTEAIQVLAYYPDTGFSEPIKGRGFIDGTTFFGNPPRAERWVRAQNKFRVKASVVKRGGESFFPGVGYPGTDDLNNGIINGSFVGAGSLVSPATFVFVADSDDDLTSYETFPSGVIIRVVVGDSIRSVDGRQLADAGVATSVVGADLNSPATLLDGVAGSMVTEPLNLSTSVPCDQLIQWSFSESVQPYTVGRLPSTVPPPLSNEFTVEFKPGVPPGFPPPGTNIQVPYTVLPASPFDLTKYVLTPVVPFPGSDPLGSVSTATITYFENAAIDLFGNQRTGTQDTDRITFEIGDCPGLVNAPVAPGVLYIASNGGGASGGIRILDLDGFGQGTGDPTHNFANPFYDQLDISKFPFNPNLTNPQAQFMFPPLSHDNTTLAGGSAGVFTLAKDSTLGDQLVDSSVVGTVADMTLGHPLDLLFNNFDCLSGGQNLCASSAFQTQLGSAVPGNCISRAPHPNPPRIRLSPSCFAPLIMNDEPTFGAANGGTATNLLGPGNAFGTLGGQGPRGLLTESTNYAGFWGPSPTATFCPTFTLRQQVGHFLYVLDSAGDQVVVLNSNRLNVLATIPVSDPRDMAISPDLNLLAVSNKGTNSLTFIDTDPRSPTFHKVIKTTSLVDKLNNRVGVAPTEVVWQPDDEDVLVICEGSNSMVLISTGSLEVRKIIPGVFQPRFLAATNRDTAFGFATGLYYAFVIGADGATKVFESGPDGPQGIGFDDFVGTPSLQGQGGFASPSAIQPNPNSLYHSTYIAYRKNGQAAVADLFLKDAPGGAQTLVVNGFVLDPNFRNKEFAIAQEYVGIFSSSSVVDLAVDDLTNQGEASVVTTQFSASQRVIPHSAKSLVRFAAGAITAGSVSAPQFLFVANSNGKLDVVDLNNGVLFVPSIPVPGVQVLCHYWRQ